MRLISGIRILITILLALGIPVFIYLGFIAKDPLFDVEYDIDLGRQTVASITADPEEYPILDPKEYPESYRYMKNLVSEITKSDDIKYRQLFKYDSIQIINRDDVLNAFCAPGGYIYVYTGLIRYLDSPDHLAGVLGHEIAHAELRHSATQLQKEYGRERLMDFIILSGSVDLSGAIGASILKDLSKLSYSRDDEANADAHSVIYLEDSKYACDGAAGFFKKLIDRGEDVNIPEFLSDHPDSQARVDAITRDAAKAGCSTQLTDPSSWNQFKTTLPPIETETEQTPAVESEETTADTDREAEN